MSELAETALADRPRPRGGPSAVKCSTPPETNNVSGTTLRLVCGLSGPQERTVRSSLCSPNQRNNLSGTKLRLAGGPSAPPWADCLPFNFEAHQRDTLSGTNLRSSGGPSAHLGQTVRQPTRASASSLERDRTVRPSGADCPPLLSQLSNLVFFKSFQNAISPHACN